MQRRKVGDTIFARNHGFTIDDELLTEPTSSINDHG
jgi:hypothetical protein